MDPLLLEEPGRRVLMMGNEAIARGSLEAGIHFCAGYPGSPSSEILGALTRVAPGFDLYTEWSANEKVALESASGASFAGLRAMATMKQNGVNVASDLLTAIALTGSPGGLVLLVCDDPGGISSTNEVDTRNYARMADVPLLEPATFQEAKDLVRWAFTLSEDLQLLVMVRSVTRISHARGVVELGTIERLARKAGMKPGDRYASLPPGQKHQEQKQKLLRARRLFETSPFNRYQGPASPDLVVVTSGTGWWYATEAVRMLGVRERVGVLKLGTTWPLPLEVLRRHLASTPTALVIEDPDPVLEYNLKAVIREEGVLGENAPRVLGKTSGTVSGPLGPGVGEMDPDLVAEAILRSLGAGRAGQAGRAAGTGAGSHAVVAGFGPAAPAGCPAGSPAAAGAAAEAPEGRPLTTAGATAPVAALPSAGPTDGNSPLRRRPLREAVQAEIDFELPRREVAFCPGCPHRASYWVMKNALRLDGRDGLLIGDIGCYSLGFGRTGYHLSRTMHCMGSAIGFASGMGKLGRFGFTQPRIAVVGDSTFFHACLPGLVNARYNQSAFVCAVLDNSATSMTGFQPHPGTGRNAMGEEAPRLSIESLCAGMGIPVEVVDPFEVEPATRTLYRLLQGEELRVLIFRHKCAVLQTREEGLPARRVFVDQQLCAGESCGCNRFCSSAFGCPALIWDSESGRAAIDEVICSRCGLCATICPKGAIRVEEESPHA